MEGLKQILKNREEYLSKVIKQKEKSLMKAPEGLLRICSNGKHPQYYHRTDPKNFNGYYIKEKNFSLAQKLAQKDYDKKVMQSAEKELLSIQKFLARYPERNLEQIYESLHVERQKLVIPIQETESQFVESWESVEYEGKGFRMDLPELYTAKGERVRSKSEVMIADLLNKEAIPYRYEYPLYLKGFDLVYPDFTVLNVKKRKEIYWEHFGMMDDSEYVEKAMKKITVYAQNGIFPGINLIVTFETRKTPLNQKTAMLMIKEYLK